MMGYRQVEQAALFYEFSLEKHVPADHLLRSIDRFVELGELRREEGNLSRQLLPNLADPSPWVVLELLFQIEHGELVGARGAAELLPR